MPIAEIPSPKPPGANQFADYLIALTRQENRVMSAYKLQKLLYYIQAWSMAERGRPAFHDAVRAWQNGPAISGVFKRFQNSFYVHGTPPQPDGLTEEDRELAYSVWMLYREYDGDQLQAMTHQEKPWLEARGDTPDDEKSDAPISLQTMREECLRQKLDTEAALAQMANEIARPRV